MLYEYEATKIGFDDSYDSLTVGFGGLLDADGHPTTWLLLQRSTDENEDEPGIDGVIVEWNDQINSCYGCIQSFELARQSIKVVFTEDANFVLSWNYQNDGNENKLTELFITFTLDENDFQELKHNLLDVIFLDCVCFSELS